jgi:gliding motility-associated-like protein
MYCKGLVFLFLLFPVIGFSQTITYPGTLNLCPATTKLLTATGYSGSPTFQWVKDGLNIPAATAATYAVTVTGSYAVIVTDGGGSVTYGPIVISATTNPVVNFSFSPDGDCADAPITFTNSSTGNSLTYVWDFNDPLSGTSANTSTLMNPVKGFVGVAGNSTQTFNVKLTATDVDGCSVTVAKDVIKKQLPSTVLIESQASKNYNGHTYFTNCSGVASQFSFFITTANTTKATNTNYKIVWGNGSADYNSSPFPAGGINQTYSPGATPLVITVTGGNGCFTSVTDYVFVGSTPGIQFGTPGNTAICTGASLTFPITNPGTNTPGTVYTVSYSDGTPDIVFSEATLPNSVTHAFNTTSCGAPSISQYNNTFSATIKAENACNSSSVPVYPIYVSLTPVAAFSASALTVCTNSTVSFNSAASVNSLNTSGACTTGVVVWKITPSTGIVVSGGNGELGDDNSGSAIVNTWTPGSTFINVKFTNAGSYDIKLRTGNSKCGISEVTKTICVNAAPTAIFTVDQSSICAGLTVQTTNSSTAPNCGANTYAWSTSYSSTIGCTPSSSSVTFNSTTVNPLFAFANPGTYTLKLIATSPGGCTSTQAVQNVTVKSKPVVNLNAASSICAGSISPSATVGLCSGITTTYAWTFTGGTPSLSASAIPGAINYATPGNYSIALDVTNECGVSTISQGLAVKTIPTVTVPVNIQQCAGTSTGILNFTGTILNTTFSWVNNNTSINLGSSGTGANISSFTLTNATASAIAATISVTPTAAGCSGPPGTFTITVNPKPSPPTVLSSLSYCQNAVAAQLTATGSNLLWYNNSGLTGGTATAPTPSTAAGGSTTYYVTQDNGTCTSSPSSITVNVTIAVTGNVISSSQTICSGSLAATLTGSIPAGGNGLFAYQWQASTDAGITWTNVPISGNSINYSPGTLTANSLFRRVVSSGACFQLLSNSISISVDAALTGTLISSSQNFCQGTATALLTGQSAGGGTGSYTYAWDSSPDNSTWSSLGVSTQNYQPPTLATTTYYRRITTSGACSATSSVTITVTPTITNNTVATSQTICLGSTATAFTASVPSGGTGGFSYQWQSSTDGGTTWGNAIGSSTNSTYNPSAVTTTTSYRRNVTSGFCSQISSNVITVTVEPALANTNISANQSICEALPNPAPALLNGQTPTGGNGIFIYSWDNSSDNSAWLPIASSNTQNYQPPALTTTTYYRRNIISNSCNATSSSVKITVYNLPTSGTLSNTVVNTCSGSTVNLSTSGFVGSVKKWQYNFTPSNNATWVDVTSSANSNVSFTNVLQSFAARVIVGQDGGCTAESISANIQVNVSAPTVPGITASDATVCTAANSNTITLTGYAGSILRWETSTDGISFAPVTNTTASINYLNLTATKWYRAVVQSGFCQPLFSSVTKITVVPNVTTSNAGVDQALCTQSIVTLNANNPTFGTGVWSQSAGPAATIANPALRNTQVTGLLPGQTYKFVWLITGPGACPSSSDEVQVINTPAITQANAGTDQVACLFTGPKDSVALNGNVLTNPAFESGIWTMVLPNPTASTPVIRNAASPSSQFIFDKTGTYRLRWTISNGVCAATSDDVLVNVFDKPFTGPLTASALTGCVGNDISISSGSTLKGSILKWQYNFSPSNPLSWVDTAVTSALITFANAQQSFDARLITRSLGVLSGCNQTDTTRISIEIIPDFTNVIDTTELAVCPGQGISIAGQLPVGAYNVFKYQWQASKDGKTNWTDIAGQTATSLNLVPLATTYIRRLVIVAPCTKISSSTYIFVRPSVGNFLVSDSIGTCFPFDVTFTNLVLPSTSTTWNFGDGAFNQGDVITHTYHSTGTFQVVMTAQYPGGCRFEATKTVTITGPKGIFKYDNKQICANVAVYFEVSSAGIDSVRWNFGDGQSVITTNQLIYHTYKQAGPYLPYAELLAGPDGACRTRINGADTIFVDQVRAGFKQSIIQNCAITQVGFSDTARAFYGVKSWSWDFGDGGTSSDQNPVHGYTATNSWKVRQIVIGNSGCRDTANNPIPLAVRDIPQIKTNKDSIACVGVTVPYIASVFAMDAIKSTVWNFSNGSGASTLSAPKIYTFPGTYMAIFVATTVNDCSDTARLPITVYPALSIDLGPDKVLATGTLLPLNSTVTNGPVAIWDWKPTTDLTCSSCDLPTATIKNNITYIVKATTAHGCTATDSISIKVFCEGAQVYVPNIFTPDGDGINDIFMVRAKGIRTVKSFRIFNRWGEVVFERTNFAPNEKTNGWDGRIKGKMATPDVYVYTYEVVCENDVSYSSKGNVTLIK